MKIQEEKQFIYEMMKDITAERRKLTDTYYDLKKRLDFLNNLEERGLEELSIEGYLDLHRKVQKETVESIISNIKRETDVKIQKIEKDNIIEEKENTPIPKEEVQKAVEKERVKRRGLISKERIKGTAITVLKNAGAPIKLSELINRIDAILDAKITRSTFQNHIISELLKENNKIDRPMKGFYQYKA